MRLDNKGWGLSDLFVGLAVIFFCLLLIVSLVNTSFKQLKKELSDNGVTIGEQDKNNTSKDNYSSYKEIETAMTNAATKYNENIYGVELQEGDNITVTLKSLIRDQYLTKKYDIKDDKILCTGYVTFIKKGDKVSYSPYLKCGKKYTTKGYLERLDAVIE